jgi:mRNA interferase RelE/StbE
MKYELIIKPSAEKSLDRIPKPTRKRILDALEALQTNPRPSGAMKMSGEENLWRIRVGDYRIVYEIHDGRLVVLVIRIAHRKDIYRKGG